MKELDKNELMGVEGGKGLLKNLSLAGFLIWVEDNWAEIKKGCYDGWNECHSCDEVDAVSYAG